MPHTTPILRRDTADIVVLSAVSDIATFKAFLEALVADCFRLHTGEILEPGTQSRAYDPIMTNSSPADLVLQIAAWWSQDRGSKFGLIAESIKRTLSAGYAAVGQEVKIEVFINAVGAPTKYRPNLQNARLGEVADLVRDWSVLELHLSERPRNCLRRAKIETIGQLFEAGVVGLMAITNFGQRSLDEIMASLDTFGHDIGATISLSDNLR